MMGKTKGPREAGPNAELQTGGHTEGGISSNGKELPDALQLHLDKVLEAIKTTREALEHKIDSVVIDVGLLRADHKKIAEKVENNKLLLADIQPKVGDNTENIARLTEKMEVLERRMEDLEGRDRRSNIRVIGIPEGTEESDMVKFLENWIREEVAGTHCPLSLRWRGHTGYRADSRSPGCQRDRLWPSYCTIETETSYCRRREIMVRIKSPMPTYPSSRIIH